MSNNNVNQNLYINRELSWIDFNKRVLELASDSRTPLLEQTKFNAIFSNNLDEFFMVRVASLKAQVEAKLTKKSEDGKTAEEQLKAIRQYLIPILKEQQNLAEKHLKDCLPSEGISILGYTQLSKKQQIWADNYFRTSLFPVLTPLAVDPAHPFPFVSNLSLNLAAIIMEPDTKKEQFVRVKIPKKTITRFLEIPSYLNGSNSKTIYTAIPIEELVAFNLNMLFPGMKILEHSFFRVTRDADLELRDLEADDLMSALEEGLRKRRLGGEVVRLEVSEGMPDKILDLLISGMNIEEADLYKSKALLGLDELIGLSDIDIHQLKFTPFNGKTHKELRSIQIQSLENEANNQKDNRESIFSIIRRQDILLHHPFDLFSTSVEEFINQCANDPKVMSIKMTLYRISKDSHIIKALTQAVENGKQVMALVELKARFDEDNNIQWAKQLEQSGVHVVYGVVGLKTHTKIILAIRREKEGLRPYYHIGTGNYNSKTSKVYTDLGLLSSQAELGQDLIELFNYLTGFSKQRTYRKLLVAPLTLRDNLKKLIKREINHVKNGKSGLIKAKMNSLVDPEIINLLYKASQAGVKIELIVRGMCCLYPGKKGISENIKVKSIIGRFLEHSRIYWFSNNKNPDVFIGSADWMRRNLDRRVEAVTCIEDSKSKKKLEDLLTTYLEHQNDSWEMNNDGTFIRLFSEKETSSAQRELIKQSLE